MKHFFFVLLFFLASCGKTDNYIRPVELEIDNAQSNGTPSIQKKEPVISCNSEPEEFTVIEMDMPAVFIKKGGNIEALIEFDRIDGSYLFLDVETSDYLIFGRLYFLGETFEGRGSIVYRKSDRCFFNFHADGGNGSLLYIINYKTRTFDFFEITDNGAKNDIVSVPIPNESDHWSVIDDKFLVSEFFGARERKEIYRLDGIIFEKCASYPSNLWIMGDSGFAYYYERSEGTHSIILIDLSSSKETRIENGGIIYRSNESMYFEAGNRLGRYDILIGIYSLMEGIAVDEYNINGYTFSDFCINGYNEYPITKAYHFKNNQLF